jgi:formylglycine-generating enzyme required for sulfatase activity
MASTQDLDLYRFIQIPATALVPYSFCIGKYPVTNAQYERFLDAPDFGDETLWRGFLKFNENCVQMGRWESEGWDWFREKSKDIKQIVPNRWNNENFGISNPENPVVGISWYEANAYCNWLLRHWNEMAESLANTGLCPNSIRLPLETEWVTAAGGETPQNRFPWDVTGAGETDTGEIVKRANVKEGGIGHTTPVNAYLCGASPHGVMDMGGNVWEWQANYRNLREGTLGLRGGSWDELGGSARVSVRDYFHPDLRFYDLGFRVVLFLTREASL